MHQMVLDCLDGAGRSGAMPKAAAAATGSDVAEAPSAPPGDVRLNRRASLQSTVDFEVPPGPVSMATAEQIIEVYRRGGSIASASIARIIREVYQDLKKRHNLRTAKLEGAGEVFHVVGDVHGQLEDLLHILDDAGLPSATNRFVFNGDVRLRAAADPLARNPPPQLLLLLLL